MGSCKTKNCKNWAVTNDECRNCRGRREFKSIVALRVILTLVGAKLKLHKGFFGPSIKKKVAKVEKTVISVSEIEQIPAKRVRIGMVLAADHGEVISKSKSQGRKLVGKKLVKGGAHGILFKTTKRNVWFPVDSMVWVVTGAVEKTV